MRTTGVLAASLCVVLIAPAVRAAGGGGGGNGSIAESPVSTSYPRIVLGVSADVGLTFGLRCPPPTSDAVGCPTIGPIAAFRLSPRWQATPTWTFGLLGGPVFVPNFGDPTSTTWWDLQAEARYYPSGHGHDESWIGAAAGLAVALDFAPAHTIDTGERHPEQTYRNYAPSASLGVGLDTHFGGRFAVGPEVRAFFFAFDTGGNSPGPVYGPQFGILLGLTVAGSVSRQQ